MVETLCSAASIRVPEKPKVAKTLLQRFCCNTFATMFENPLYPFLVIFSYNQKTGLPGCCLLFVVLLVLVVLVLMVVLDVVVAAFKTLWLFKTLLELSQITANWEKNGKTSTLAAQRLRLALALC